ncbi:MAG: TIR domain-containing protein [Bacteroidales bacterium]|nr:TIR domain-containing protein [Bacteroidales bacterium]
MSKEKCYFAFISYKREDEEWAKWLQHKLEHYKLPSNLNGRSDLPKEIRPIFRDKSDLAGGVLAEEINDALENSQYLIVICSPHAAHSEWVSKEVKAFIDMGRSDKIIPFIIGGTAHAQNPEEECFPVTLREMPADQELLGVNINEMGRDAAAVKVVAQMFGLKFDELWQRWEREQKRKRNWIVAASVLAVLVMAGIASWIWQKNQNLLVNQSRFVAEKANNMIKDGDPYTSQRILLEVLPQNLKHPNRPYTIEAEKALRNACYNTCQILKGSAFGYNSTSFSPNGKLIVAACQDKTVRIRDAMTGKEIRVLQGHIRPVISALFSPDGKRIVSVSDHDAKIWDVITGEMLFPPISREYITHIDGYISGNSVIAFSPDGSYLASALLENINICNSESGKILKTINCPDVTIVSISVSPNGKQIVAATREGVALICDVDSGKTIRTLVGHTGELTSVAFSPEGDHILSASKDKTIRIWDAVTGETIRILGCNGEVYVASFSPDGKLIVSASYKNTVSIFNWETGNILYKLDGDATTAVFSPDGKRVLAGHWIWELETMGTNRIFNNGKSSTIVYFSPDGRLAVTTDETINVWDIETGELIKTIEDGFYGGSHFAFSSDGKWIASVLGADFQIWNLKTGKLINNFEEHTGYVNSIVFSPDGKRLVSASNDGTARVWDVETGEELQVFEHRKGVDHASFSPDGKRVVTACQDKNLWQWDTDTGDLIYPLEGHTDRVGCAVYNPAGKWILSSSWDGTVRIWDANTGDIIRSLSCDTPLFSASFSPDGKLIVAGSWSHSVRVWDAESGMEFADLVGFNNRNYNASFGPDGKTIMSSSDDGIIRIWNYPPLQDLIDQTRERFKDRPLTPEERRMYYLE